MVSKLCCEVVHTSTIRIDQINQPYLDCIYNKIYERYPKLNNTDYNLFWCYDRDEFFKIRDFMSYFCALTLMAHRAIYLILNDGCDDCLEVNEAFLRKLDRIEEKEMVERKRDKYDVKIIRPGEKSDSDDEEVEEFRRERRKDVDVLRFALRKEEDRYYYTVDLQQKFRMIEDAKRGIFDGFI